MAKKKINNVVIKDEELTPTTIGVYSNKTKNPITLLLLVAVFVSIAFFMPDIQSYVSKVLGKGDTNEVNNNNGGQTDPDVDPDDDNDVQEEGQEYDVSVGTVETKNYTLSNISFSGNTFKVVFTSKLSSGFDLSDYYLEFYSSEGTFVKRVKVSDDMISSTSSREFVFNNIPNASKFAFVKKTVDDYPQVSLNYNENLEANLVCRLDTTLYNYLFIDNQLSRITETFSYSKTNNSDFYEVGQEYQYLANTYNAIDGVTSTFTETLNDFYFTMNVDLSKTDISKINDKNVFANKTEPRVVKFIVESRGFSCQQQ